MEETTKATKKNFQFLGNSPSYLGTSILVSALVISGTLIYVFGPSTGGSNGTGFAPTDNEGAVLPDVVRGGAPEVGDAPFLGDEDAPVTIVEYSDFQCPFCAKFFNESLPRVIAEYVHTGKARFVYKDFPLSSIHPQAQKAAEAARCVRDQLGNNEYWRMHDRIFDGQDLLGVSSFKQWAREIGVNGSEFDGCLDSDKYASAVATDIEEGIALGVTGTPTFFINGTRIVGAVPYEQIRAVIEQELADAN